MYKIINLGLNLGYSVKILWSCLRIYNNNKLYSPIGYNLQTGQNKQKAIQLDKFQCEAIRKVLSIQKLNNLTRTVIRKKKINFTTEARHYNVLKQEESK